jgi:hypothetical protein
LGGALLGLIQAQYGDDLPIVVDLLERLGLIHADDPDLIIPS